MIMEILTAAKITVAIATIGGGAIALDARHVSQDDFAKFTQNYAASNYVRDLLRLGATFGPNGRVHCAHLQGNRRQNCFVIRQYYYEIKPPAVGRRGVSGGGGR